MSDISSQALMVLWGFVALFIGFALWLGMGWVVRMAVVAVLYKIARFYFVD